MNIFYHVTSKVGVNVSYVWPGEPPVHSWHFVDFTGTSYEVLPDRSLIVGGAVDRADKVRYHARFPPESLPSITITVKTETFPCSGYDFVAKVGM